MGLDWLVWLERIEICLIWLELVGIGRNLLSLVADSAEGELYRTPKLQTAPRRADGEPTVRTAHWLGLIGIWLELIPTSAVGEPKLQIAPKAKQRIGWV